MKPLFKNWIFSPTDCHGIASELCRGLFLFSTIHLFSYLLLFLSHQLNFHLISDTTLFYTGIIIGLMTISWCISADTLTGTTHLTIFSHCAYYLSTTSFILANGLLIAVEILLFSYSLLMLSVWLAIRSNNSA